MPRAPRDLAIEVLHRDEDLLAVNKPSGLPTTSPDDGDCLAKRVRAMDPGAERCHPSSRLDVDVTGVVVFARTSRGIDLVLRAREEHRYARRYVALAHAPRADAETLPDASIAWRWGIAIDPRDPRLRRALEPGQTGERAQEAHTRARVLARSASAVSLLLEPVTGRTHQLRVHAARAGMPLLGDTAYGGARRIVSSEGRVAMCPRVALHCVCVVLPQPSGSALTLHAPWPRDLVSVTDELGLPAIDASAIVTETRAAWEAS